MAAANYNEMVAYVRDAAIKRGINPDVALEVARREALNVFDPSQPDLGGDDRSSFGIYQLHYGGRSKKMPNAGLGDEFTAATGLDASDPKTWKQQVDFSLDYAKKHGWGSWMGAKAAGITGMAGIDGKPVNFAKSGAADGAASGGNQQVASAAPPPKDDSGPLLMDFPARSLADDLSASVDAPLVSRGDTRSAPTPVVSEDAGFTPAPEFASAIPEAPPPVPDPTPAGLVADISAPLADLFKVKDIGQAGAVDPRTGQPVLPKPFRALG